MKATATEQAAKLCDKGSRLRIITDEKFNILWNSKDFEPGEIAFSDIKGKTPKDGAVFSVYVNGNCHSAECIAVNTDSQKLFIWTLCTASENIFRLGYTNTYKEVSYIFDTLKNNIDILAHLAEVIARESPEVKTTANEQTRICRDLTRHFKRDILHYIRSYRQRKNRADISGSGRCYPSVQPVSEHERTCDKAADDSGGKT